MATRSTPSTHTATPTASAGIDDARATAQRAERRRQILVAAKQVFAAEGYHGASINQIIERAQIARGTFYLYFQSKAAIFDSILDQAMADVRARITRIEVDDPSAPPPALQLRDNLVRTLEYVVGDRDLAAIVLTSGKAAEPEAIDRLDGFFAELRGLIARALEQGVEMKLVRPCHTQLAAAALLGSVRGVIKLMVTEPSPPTVDTIVNELIAVALRGVLA
jgi:AcrR family transcriptional regulator